ncbi:hypothetical protein B0H17DRAFT_1059704 [Mycena rosella]|uniref:Uncharacterized protein n=1 Tax=Mycena rosella TaxID=1033263 RepID=A0AAD7DJM1_MYCRO|nr:hypothetical protein B0H17DRAFT_1059704 [Mycena rosella]
MTKGPPSDAAGPSRPSASQGPRYPMSGPGLPPQLPQHPGVQQAYYQNRPPEQQHYSQPEQQHYPPPPQTQWGNSWSPGYSNPQQQQQQPTYRSSNQRYAPAPVQQQAQYVAQPPYAAQPQQAPYVAQGGPQRTRFAEPYPHSKAVPKVQLQTPPIVPSQAPAPPPPPPPVSPPPPPPPKYRHWDKVIKDFLTRLGLKQALSGFELDMLVMNVDFERANVPEALTELLQGILLLRKGDVPTTPEQNRPLDDRKLDYVHTPNPSSQTSITKSISAFLADNRAKNDASNRAEFLHSLAEKRKRVDDEVPDVSSCARTDAKPVDRDVQMKYDIAKNSDGPLRRTTRLKTKAPEAPAPAPATSPTSTRPKTKSMARELKKAASPVVVKAEPDAKPPALHLHSGLDQRVGNIETHFSVRYVPAQPDSLLARLQFLEDHIVQLERDYPPWAALHFNQPNRGWPPPPRATPIIVPPHLRSGVSAAGAVPPPKVVGGVKTKNTGSSLQRAVMDQLAMKEARSDLAGNR